MTTTERVQTNGNGSSNGKRVPPFSVEAERAVLGTMLTSPEARATAFDFPLHATDFYRKGHALMFSAIETLHAEGRPVDVQTVAETLRRADKLATAGGRGAVFDLLAEAGNVTSYHSPEYVRTVGELAGFRRAITYAGRIGEAAYAADLDELVHVMQGGVDDVVGDLGADLTAEPPEDVLSFERTTDKKPKTFVVQDLLVRGDRYIITGAEGSGKTTMLRQFAVQCAAGIHPFTLHDASKLKVVHFDLQDSEEQSRLEYLWLLEKGNARSRIAPGGLTVQRRRQGFDILNRGDAKWFESRIAPRGERPADVVILGPLYKSFRSTDARHKHDTGLAEEVTARFDEILTRTGACLLLEAHSPQGVTNDRAQFRPEGSAQWLRWPEFGHALKPMKIREGESESRGAHVTRFRGDRDRSREWPTMLFYGKGEQWPFLAPLDQVL